MARQTLIKSLALFALTCSALDAQIGSPGGMRGPSGAGMNTIQSGITIPANGKGANGDFYLNTASNCLYGPKAASVWPGACVSLVGPAGVSGAAGPAGPQGPAGVAGPQGVAGAPGTSGNTVLSGAAAPSGGNNGDFYLNLTTKCLYGPKALGTWPGVCTSLVGPAGATGATGPIGITGATGPIGPTGLTGSAGPTGATGPAGAAGAAGVAGTSGSNGVVVPTRYTVNIGSISSVATWVVNAITPTFVTVPSLGTQGDLNDLTVGSGFTGSTATYCVQITALGAPDVFSWGTGGSCANGATGIAVTGASQTLSNGFAVSFGATTGHALTKWTILATVGSAVSAAATTQNVNVFTMPARAKALGFSVKQSSPFTGIANENATNGLTGTLGWATGNAAYLGSCDLGQAVSNTQQCDIGGQFSTTFASHVVTITFTSACSAGSCFLSGLTNTASVDIWPTVMVLP